jgi:hypothetical protein
MGSQMLVQMSKSSENFYVDSDIFKGAGGDASIFLLPDGDKTAIMNASCNWTDGEPGWGSVPENWRLGLWQGFFSACKAIISQEIDKRNYEIPGTTPPGTKFLKQYGVGIAVFGGLLIAGVSITGYYWNK